MVLNAGDHSMLDVRLFVIPPCFLCYRCSEWRKDGVSLDFGLARTASTDHYASSTECWLLSSRELLQC
jgi:hypothetical protein